MATSLGTDVSSLLREGVAVGDPVRGAVRFRANEGLEGVPADDRRLLALAARVSATAGHVARELELAFPLPAPAATAVTEPAWRQGYALAEKVRVNLGLVGPVHDLLGHFEGWGVQVAFVPFSLSDIHAAAVAQPGGLPTILVNTRSGIRSQRAHRALLAHELCHLLHDASPLRTVTAITRKSWHHQAVEQRANGFAPNFLAPASELQNFQGDDFEFAQHLMDRWGFSKQGAAWHAKNIRRFPHERVAEIEDATRVRGGTPPVFRVPRPSAERPFPNLHPLTTGLVERVVMRAWREGLIGRQRAVEILSLA